MEYCVMCGSPLPGNQGSNTCSMCYGDVDHGHDGYYHDWLLQEAERWEWRQAEREYLKNEAGK